MISIVFFFQLLEENIICFVKTELKRFKRVLRPDYQEYFGRQKENEEELDKEDEEERSSSREAFLKITLHFLRKMKHVELADRLESSKRIFQIFNKLDEWGIYVFGDVGKICLCLQSL